MADKNKVAVVGGGSWGTTFAQILADSGHEVCVWARREIIVEMINGHENSTYLPGVVLADSIRATTDLKEAVEGAELVVVAVPTAVLASTISEAVKYAPDAIYAALAKGIEVGSRKTVTEVMAEAGGLPDSQVAVISGPNLSMEIAMQQPAASVVASKNLETAKQIARACHNTYFRPYVSTDLVGVEVAGATKNVLALAIGAAEGMGFGANTRATLITRGLAEMTRLGIALGAQPGTFAGLAGIGDLVATCSSKLSRNYSLGYRLGRGLSLEDALSLSPGVAEGTQTVTPLLQLADENGVDMPIARGVFAVISGGATVEQMGEMLLGRPQKMDGWEIELLD